MPRWLARPLVLGCLVLLLAACDTRAGQQGAGAGPVTPATAPAAEADRPATDLLVERFDLPLGPDWMVADAHGVWVKRDLAPLLLLDPASDRVVGRVRVPYELPLCQGIGAGYGYVWVCHLTDLVKIDPATMSVVAHIGMEKTYSQGHLPTAFGRLWVLQGDGSTLLGLDPSTNEVVSRFRLPARGFDVTAGPDGLWVPCRVDDTVLEVDPRSGKVLVRAEAPAPEYATVEGGQVWVAGGGTTVRLDPATGAVVASVDAGAEPLGSIASDDHYVWVRNADDFLVQIDKDTGQRVGRITADITSGGDVVVADGDVWVSAVDDATVLRLRPDGP